MWNTYALPKRAPLEQTPANPRKRLPQAGLNTPAPMSVPTRHKVLSVGVRRTPVVRARQAVRRTVAKVLGPPPKVLQPPQTFRLSTMWLTLPRSRRDKLTPRVVSVPTRCPTLPAWAPSLHLRKWLTLRSGGRITLTMPNRTSTVEFVSSISDSRQTTKWLCTECPPRYTLPFTSSSSPTPASPPSTKSSSGRTPRSTVRNLVVLDNPSSSIH